MYITFQLDEFYDIRFRGGQTSYKCVHHTSIPVRYFLSIWALYCSFEFRDIQKKEVVWVLRQGYLRPPASSVVGLTQYDRFVSPLISVKGYLGCSPVLEFEASVGEGRISQI